VRARASARTALALATSLAALGACATLGRSSVDETLERARASLGRAAFAAGAPAWRIAGRTVTRAGEGRFEDVLDARGRFVRRLAGPLACARGFDGRLAWRADDGGPAHAIGLDARLELLGDGWLPWGQWADDLPGGPAIGLDPRRSGVLVLALGETWQASLELDRETGLPRAWEARSAQGALRAELSDWRSPHGFALPFHIEVLGTSGAPTVLLVESVESVEPASADLAFGPPPRTGARDVELDPDRDAELEARTGPAGHLFVRGEVGGESGWFLIDSGAGRGVIDESLAERHGWAVVGEVGIVGAGGLEPARLRAGEPFVLGPLRRKSCTWAALDLSDLRALLDVPLVGILGFDLLSQVVLELDLAAGRAWLRDPERWDPAPDRALPVVLDGTAPCIRARYEPGVEGWFRIDTGSDDTIAFHTATVARQRWSLREEEMVPVVVSGFGPPARGARARLGWFELAGERLVDVPVTLLTTSAGALRRPSISGNLGVGLLRPFRVVLDLGRERVVLTRRAAQ